MVHSQIVSENQLDEYVRMNAREVEGVIPELLSRLIAASVKEPMDRRFPLGDSITQQGPDGILVCQVGFPPFVPSGRSIWEIGTGDDPRRKATEDYAARVASIPLEVRRESTFVFVTPRSARRSWPHTWNEGDQAAWVKDRRSRNDWSDVWVLDGSKLVDWLADFPGVEKWLARRMGLQTRGLFTPEELWQLLSATGAPPALSPEVFLSGRELACRGLQQVLSGEALELRVDTHFPDQMVDLAVAFFARAEAGEQAGMANRCLVISDPETWESMAALRDPHLLVADFDINSDENAGTRLLQMARQRGHSVIYGGRPGGPPHPNRVQIGNPRCHELEEALRQCGYPRERARLVATQCGGNLSSMKRLLNNLSLAPEWAQGTDAPELAAAALMGAWNENNEADRAVIARVAGKTYADWVECLRRQAQREGAPLSFRDGVWRFVPRYEGWYALGPQVSDAHIERLQETAIVVLRERDPKFELPPDERYTAGIRAKTLRHSAHLRRGLAECLALLGSHPKAMCSSSLGKPESAALVAVREILKDADWVAWASVDPVLPLLAEAAPSAFLDAVEAGLEDGADSAFAALFGQEGSGLFGANYMTGLLWGLENLAWHQDYLTRVTVILGRLADIDPGGNWANRPCNSLTTIFLPWLPQTCAPLAKGFVAVETLLRECPDPGWALLLSLLPQLHGASFGSHKPSWRQFIPMDWPEGVSRRDYSEQVEQYARLAIQVARTGLGKLAALVDRLNDLPLPAFNAVLDHLSSPAFTGLSEADRSPIWERLANLATKHRRYADAEWAIRPELVVRIEQIAATLEPGSAALRNRRLFDERADHLMEEKGNYEEQGRRLQERRDRAVTEVIAEGGVDGLLSFARAVGSPWEVGCALGRSAPAEIEGRILPEYLLADCEHLGKLAAGLVWDRFWKSKWAWVDSISFTAWSDLQKAEFFSLLPFQPETWRRATEILGQREPEYWKRARVNPYQVGENLKEAVERLLQNGRARAALQCLARMVGENTEISPDLAIEVLKANLTSDEPIGSLDPNAVRDVIRWLQDNPQTDPHALSRIEWGYLPFLDKLVGGAPKALEMRLSQDAGFFCELIRTVYRSKKEQGTPPEPTEERKRIAVNAYRLLHEWRTPPGTKTDGSFDGDTLDAWLKAVKAATSETGHFEVAVTHVGHVLAYAPGDPSGLWIHHAAASALNARDAEDMRLGFRCEMFNKRGVYGFTAGAAERELAAKYRDMAEAVEAHGYYRLAETMRGLAEAYERDAEGEATRDTFED